MVTLKKCPLFQFRLLLSCLFIFCHSALVVADCSVLESENQQLTQQLSELRSLTRSLSSLSAGHVQPEFSLRQVFNFHLDSELAVQAAIQRNTKLLAALSAAPLAAEAEAGCETEQIIWRDLSAQVRETNQALIQHRLALLKRSAADRMALEAIMGVWRKLHDSMPLKPEQLKSSSVSGLEPVRAQDKSIVQARELLSRQYQKFVAMQGDWLRRVLSEERDASAINRQWLAFSKQLATDTQVLWFAEDIPPDLYRLRQLIEQANSSLGLRMNQWRNRAILAIGWRALVEEIKYPGVVVEALFFELQSAPFNVLDSLLGAFLREYQLAHAQSEQGQLFTRWALQSIGLLVLIYLLIQSAAHAPSRVASLQQSMMTKFESRPASSLISGFFWMLKPNASWLYILLTGYFLQHIVPDQWTILKLITPLAMFYALLRAIRIIIEWCLSRTYTRSGLFLSNHASEQLALQGQRMVWMMLIVMALWAFAYATGGGYLIYLLGLIGLVYLWAAFWWILYKNESAVSRFIQQVLNINLGVDKSKQKVWSGLLSKLAWPVLFIVAHALDVVASLNQKLMVFDVYRSFSVKLLRVRLESRSEEVAEDDDAEPDQSYSGWMLREVPDNLLLDIGETGSLLEPIKRWYSDKTDENVLVIAGESGSGKSTLVRRFPGLWDQSPINILDVPPKVTATQVLFDQLAEVLGIEPFTDIAGLVRQAGNIEPQVVIIDSANNLFLAEVGKFEAYKALLECLNAHLDNIFWVLVMHAPSWVYLNYVFVREQRISHVYKMPRWSPLDIRRLILSRHQGGRRRLKYNEMLLSAAASSESSSVRAADSRVFNLLWEQCGGNPLAAIELWITAVKVKGRVAEVGVPQRPSANLLNGFKDDLFFVYASIVSHASLSTKEIMLVTHFSEPVVRHAIKQGINLGMIIRDETQRYQIDPCWYGTLSGLLHRKNMLWS